MSEPQKTKKAINTGALVYEPSPNEKHPGIMYFKDASHPDLVPLETRLGEHGQGLAKKTISPDFVTDLVEAFPAASSQEAIQHSIDRLGKGDITALRVLPPKAIEIIKKHAKAFLDDIDATNRQIAEAKPTCELEIAQAQRDFLKNANIKSIENYAPEYETRMQDALVELASKYDRSILTDLAAAVKERTAEVYKASKPVINEIVIMDPGKLEIVEGHLRFTGAKHQATDHILESLTQKLETLRAKVKSIDLSTDMMADSVAQKKPAEVAISLDRAIKKLQLNGSGISEIQNNLTSIQQRLIDHNDFLELHAKQELDELKAVLHNAPSDLVTIAKQITAMQLDILSSHDITDLARIHGTSVDKMNELCGNLVANLQKHSNQANDRLNGYRKAAQESIVDAIYQEKGIAREPHVIQPGIVEYNAGKGILFQHALHQQTYELAEQRKPLAIALRRKLNQLIKILTPEEKAEFEKANEAFQSIFDSLHLQLQIDAPNVLDKVLQKALTNLVPLEGLLDKYASQEYTALKQGYKSLLEKNNPLIKQMQQMQLALLERLEPHQIQNFEPDRLEEIKKALQEAKVSLKKAIDGVEQVATAAAKVETAASKTTTVEHGATTKTEATTEVAEAKGFVARLKQNMGLEAFREAPLKTTFRAGGVMVGLGMVADATLRGKTTGEAGEPTNRSVGGRGLEALLGVTVAGSSALLGRK